MKRPAFQFYPADWFKDPGLRSCTVAARGLWIDIIALMHQAEPYGHLVVNGSPVEIRALARMVGASPREITKLINELESSGVFSRTDEGAIYSRRMVRDEDIRERRAAGGKLGGNPALKDGRKVNHRANLKPTPSSSSSSSDQPPPLTPPRLSRSGTTEPRSPNGSRLASDWTLPDEWRDWSIGQGMPHDRVQAEAAKFGDYWHGIPGAKGRKADWLGTWRNWCRRAMERSHENGARSGQQGAGGGKLSAVERVYAANGIERR